MTRVYARMLWSGVRPSHSTSNSRLSQTSHLFTFWCYLEVRMAWTRKRSWTADDCVAWIQIVLPWATANRKSTLLGHCSLPEEDWARTTRHFYRVFSCKRLSSRTARTEGVYPNQPRLQENLLCRADWLCLRGVATTECAILPTRELGTCPWYSACEHSSSGERPSARQCLPAPVLIDGFSWQPDHVPWFGIRGGPLTKSDWLSVRVAHTECVIIMVQATVNY